MACVDIVKAAEAVQLKVEKHAQIEQGMIESLMQERGELEQVRDSLNDIIVQFQTQQNYVSCNENVSAYS